MPDQKDCQRSSGAAEYCILSRRLWKRIWQNCALLARLRNRDHFWRQLFSNYNNMRAGTARVRPRASRD